MIEEEHFMTVSVYNMYNIIYGKKGKIQGDGRKSWTVLKVILGQKYHHNH